MAEINADTWKGIAHAHAFGNRTGFLAKVTLAAAAIADEVQLMKLPAGSQLLDWFSHNAALGASTTISYGWKYADGSAGGGAAVLAAAASTSSAGMTRSAVAPIKFTKDVIITATVGGGVATGVINFVPNYIYEGNL
ncbi:MAG TPA: hypothetical protein ENJ24_01855 [Gammaproteobacteria bacterium]|nr:hypothetical protein [Gammaproteobacteria bacterium]